MLKAFQKRERLKKVVFVFILVLTVVGMVVYLIPGFTGFGTDPTISGVVAEVEGEEIQAFELQQTMLQFGQQNRIPAEMMEFYRTRILEDMLLERATLRAAERLGLRVSEAEVVERLRRVPDLFPDGKFVGREAYEDIVYARFQMTAAEFERRFRNGILQEKLRNLVTDSVAVYPEEVRKAFVESSEKLVVDYAMVETSALRAEIRPTDEALQTYFQTNQARYQVPEKRAGRFIAFNEILIGLGIAIPEADVQRYYQTNQNDFRVEERVQASHILLRADPARTAEIKKKAEDLLTRLKGGADFAAVARENSEDPGSAAKGGDLGWIVRGQTVPEFETAAFSLAPGSLSGLVETSFGIHILKVAAHEQARLRPLEEGRAEIELALRRERVQAIIPQKAEEAAAALRNAPNDAQAIAARVGGRAENFGPLTLQDPIPGVGGSGQLGQEIFSLEKDVVGRPIPIQTGTVVPLVTEVLPAHPGTFEEVKDRVRSEYVEEQARERASAKATQLAEALGKQERKDLKRAAQALGLAVKTSDPVTRATPVPSVGNLTEFDPALFTKAAGDVAGPFPTPSGHIVLQIASRQAPKEEDFAGLQPTLEQRILDDKKDQAFAIFQDNLRSTLEARGDLVIYQDVLSRVGQAIPGEHPPYPHSHPPGF